jgi:hypothetical protein
MSATENDDLEEIELGERAAYWQLHEQLGSLYRDLKDRVWAVAIGCYAKCVISLGADNVPPEWKPHTDEDGMWKMP